MNKIDLTFILHLPPSSFSFSRRRSQVVRQRSAKPLFIGSIPIAASNTSLLTTTYVDQFNKDFQAISHYRMIIVTYSLETAVSSRLHTAISF